MALFSGQRRRMSTPAIQRDFGNIVEPYRILGGLEVRTTVMLRNIPNKVTAYDICRVLQKTSAGRYDFVYLRVDFANQCNVGYAFINFVAPNDIIEFYIAVAGESWNVFTTDKVAQLCFATIQGKGALIDRFRNSGVMAQWEPFRAHVYYSDEDQVPRHMCGQMAPFPEPNNHVKVRSSCCRQT
jgi:RNA recognition motif 2